MSHTGLLSKVLYAFILTIVIFTWADQAFAHGEEQAGPHDGFIQMPGAFHTEVVPQSHGFRIYLLDMNFKNPTSENSKIAAKVKTATTESDLRCEARQDYFFCAHTTPTQKGELILTTSRNGAAGRPATYRLPLVRNSSKSH